MTVAWTIPSPFRGRMKDGSIGDYRPALVTIWHVDPESDGSDDSCGFSRPKLTAADLKIIDRLCDDDRTSHTFISDSIPQRVRNPEYQYGELLPGDALALTACAWMLVAKETAHATGNDHGGWRKVAALSNAEWWQVVQLSQYPFDNIQSCLNDEDRDRAARTFFKCVLIAYRRFHRKWWQHPRWHVHHWSIQIHPLQDFKRWAFSRCCKCGGRFTWGYCPTSDSWHGTGPQWFKSEKHVYHNDCRYAKENNCAAQ